jgi:hypothetical protein
LVRFVLLLVILPLLAACSIAQPLQIEPARKATPISPRFSESYYSYDRDQTLSFVLRSKGTDASTGKPVEQVATIRVFWRPKGGVTTLNPSALNATFRYVVMTPDALGIYEGAGFVLLNSRTGAAKFQARVMDADMRLTQKSVSFIDNLGRAHMRGYFTASYNDEKTAEVLLQAQQEFFGRSLEAKPAPTAPASSPAASQP